MIFLNVCVRGICADVRQTPFWRNDKFLSWKDQGLNRVGSEAAWSFSWFVPFSFFKTTFNLSLSLTVIPRTSSPVSKFSVSRFHVLCRCCARRWRDGAAGNSSARSDDNGKCFHLQRQVLKVMTKGWRHRAHPDPAAQPRPLRRRRRRRRKSTGVWDERVSFVWSLREGSLFSGHISGILRQDFANCNLSTFVNLPCLTFALWNVNVSAVCQCCIWLHPGCFYDCRFVAWTDMISLAGLWRWSGLLCRW